MFTGSIASTVLAKNLPCLLDQSPIKNWSSAWHNRLLEESAFHTPTYTYTPSSRYPPSCHHQLFTDVQPDYFDLTLLFSEVFLSKFSVKFFKALHQVTINVQTALTKITPSIC